MIDKLSALAKRGMTLGLERITRVLEALGHPERAYPCVHIAGSNGKGSTAAFTASILSAHGLEVGLYTSPHLVSLTERVQFVRRSRAFEIAPETLVDCVEEVERVAPNLEGLSYFEALTAAGLVAFRSRRVGTAVIEAGLGARLDATKLVDAHVAVLTDLALEHTEVLGDTLAAIAREKIHVARPRRPLVAADAPPEAQVVIDEGARSIGAPLFSIGRELFAVENADGTFDLELGDRKLSGVSLSLLGAHQGRNAVLAVKAATLLQPKLTDSELRFGLAHASWPGRLEVFQGEPPVLLDGAHNPQGAEILAAAVAARRRSLFRGPLHFVFGVLADKDAGRMLAAVAPLAETLILTRPGSARARDPREVSSLLDAKSRARAAVIEAPLDALHQASMRARDDGGWVIVCGSLYLIGDVRPTLLERLRA